MMNNKQASNSYILMMKLPNHYLIIAYHYHQYDIVGLTLNIDRPGDKVQFIAVFAALKLVCKDCGIQITHTHAYEQSFQHFTLTKF